VSRGGQFVYAGFLFGFGRHIGMTLSKSLATIRQAQKLACAARKGKGREPAVRGPPLPRESRRSGNVDFPWLDLLRFGQSQSQDALVDLCADLVCVDRWIDLEGASIIFAARFMMDQRAFDGGNGTASDNRQLVVLDRYLEAVLVHARHFDLQPVTLTVFDDAGDRRDEMFVLAKLTVAIVAGHCVHVNSFRKVLGRPTGAPKFG